jgi:hypothetical protein
MRLLTVAVCSMALLSSCAAPPPPPITITHTESIEHFLQKTQSVQSPAAAHVIASANGAAPGRKKQGHKAVGHVSGGLPPRPSPDGR